MALPTKRRRVFFFWIQRRRVLCMIISLETALALRTAVVSYTRSPTRQFSVHSLVHSNLARTSGVYALTLAMVAPSIPP
ncbi:hypothetical protein EDB86DRAFT_2092707 [Lactarius hatsudake]|nr:hypothetical protein EDB86DRAFT_2092707 [Lactarius hatsudake]